MKKILCYGDSNTYGYNPADSSRFDEETRWTALLQNNLADGYEVIEEGACDRTAFVDNDKGFLFSAQRHFPKLLAKTNSVDILVFALGTNDMQFKYDISFGAVERGLENLISSAKSKFKKIIIIPPVVLSDNVLSGFFNFQFDGTSIVKSKKIGKIYRHIARVYDCKIFDINKFAQPSDADGLHYDSAAHKLIADKLSELIRNI